MSTESIVGQLVRLSLTALGADWSGTFNRLEVWRSKLGANGAYEELTGAAAAPPRVPRDAPDPPASPVEGRTDDFNGKVLSILLNEDTQVDIAFVGTLLSRAEVADQVIDQSAGQLNAYVDELGNFVVEGVATGSSQILRVLPTSASGILGLPSTEPDSYSYGRDPRITLVPGQEVYEYIDYHGSKGAYYQTRFRDTSTGYVSGFSAPIPAEPTPIDFSGLVIGYVTLVDALGRPTANREVRVESDFTGVLVDGRAVVGLHEARLTDINGYVEFRLIRGMQLQVGIAGTRIARTITTPTDPSVERFNLLAAAVGDDDLFVVQVPQIDFAVRSSL